MNDLKIWFVIAGLFAAHVCWASALGMDNLENAQIARGHGEALKQLSTLEKRVEKIESRVKKTLPNSLVVNP